MNRSTWFTTLAAAAATLALALSACSTAQEQEEVTPMVAEQEWPRTIEIPADASGKASSITIEAAPTRIAALDYESAEVLAELGLADRLVLIPEAVLNPALGSHTEELAEVANTVPVAMALDAETVISNAPDLVILSPRHGAEESIGSVLEQAGITALQLPSAWTSTDSLLEGIELIGDATGTEESAQELSTTISDGLKGSAGETAGNGPRVLVLTNQAGRPFATAGQAFPLELLGLAGASDVSLELGLAHTSPITAEQIVEANPDGIVLIDMNGTGDRMYAELLASPAIASLPALTQDHLLRIEGKNVQALGLQNTIDGLNTLREWVVELR